MVSHAAKFAICLILVVLSVLLTKGLSYSLPNVKPVSRSSSPVNTTCPDIKSISECRPCTGYEKNYLKLQCSPTGNIETVTCNRKTNKEFKRSCPYASKAETKRFWVFEGCMILVSMFSNVVVWWRRRSLDGIKYQRLKRQISDAV